MITKSNLQTTVYATDGSVYREYPKGVSFPTSVEKVQELVRYATRHKSYLVPRGAGTSLGGQAIGEQGIVVDFSRYMNRILTVNEEEKWVAVEPGVVLEVLNKQLRPAGLMFGPETSTSSRCTIGGMLGNNSCGTHSPAYGSVRDHIRYVKCVLADGSLVTFRNITQEQWAEKRKMKTLEGKIYAELWKILSSQKNRQQIADGYPDPRIKRRNTGYALDELARTAPFEDGRRDFNISYLLAGSEGTLCMSVEIGINLVPLPPKETALVCLHCNSLEEACYANLVALQYNPSAVELMDDVILKAALKNPLQKANSAFVKKNPAAIIFIELNHSTKKAQKETVKKLIAELNAQKFGYASPVLYGDDITKAWDLRKAGLGVLSNIPGEDRAVALVEDCALPVEKLPDYIKDFKKMLQKYGKESIYYAHIGSGELHNRPILNLKKKKDGTIFRQIGEDTARLVKKYRGSMSGEHGDGRVRSALIPIILGEANMKLLVQVKQLFDPNNLFNRGIIVNPKPMEGSFRFSPTRKLPFTPIYDWSDTEGIVKAAENCNGSGDCRKPKELGGGMCPSYQASGNELLTTRARSNAWREFLVEQSISMTEMKQILSQCLSCKACKRECPSNMDVTKIKAEFLQYYYDNKGLPFATRIIAHMPTMLQWAKKTATFYNIIVSTPLVASLIKQMSGMAKERHLPKFPEKPTFATTSYPITQATKVLLLWDEFGSTLAEDVALTAKQLLRRLGYQVEITPTLDTGRTMLSKGLVRSAKKKINHNIMILSALMDKDTVLVGIEPSSILTVRDEFVSLAMKSKRKDALALAEKAFSVEEFLAEEYQKGNIKQDDFTAEEKKISLHGHCYQKALGGVDETIEVLSIPPKYSVEEIPSGCCGMAGSFGMEKPNYRLSQKVGELILFPTIRSLDTDSLVVAAGMSCRHQIEEGTGRNAQHPVMVLWDAVKK